MSHPDFPVVPGGFAQLPLVSSTALGSAGARDDWETPIWLYDLLDEEFRFSLDAAASERTHKAASYITEAGDGLAIDWQKAAPAGAAVWLNPPYGRAVGSWVKKAAEESRRGLTVVVLIFSRTDTSWWHDYAMAAAEIRFIRGRLSFLQDGEPRHPAPAPSCVLVFKPGSEGPPALKTIEKAS
jgi:phage N-6-adenine-methyltransferase